MIDKDFYNILQEFEEIDPQELTDEQIKSYEATVNNAHLDAQEVMHRRGIHND